MRTDKELLALLLFHLRRGEIRFRTGLCSFIVTLYELDAITEDEQLYLTDLIYNNIPDRFTIPSISAMWYYNGGGYWWDNGKKQPRVAYVRYLIRLNNSGRLILPKLRK